MSGAVPNGRSASAGTASAVPIMTAMKHENCFCRGCTCETVWVKFDTKTNKLHHLVTTPAGVDEFEQTKQIHPDAFALYPFDIVYVGNETVAPTPHSP